MEQVLWCGEDSDDDDGSAAMMNLDGKAIYRNEEEEYE
ncbi:hypothetical protein L195_g008131 [Trifolium pratense]|uniref:Uncharacterized protein n=1 Tax=Trifolium pratense TaxID=57577 RepID=A0A2K3P8C2_TRIPR|nr:hypothetical protein L195_g008131 [Trifolium pratense]